MAENSLVDGRYRIQNRIGSGGMADVYLAEDAHLGRSVALKMLHRRFARDEDFVERFRREASSAASLQHPHVVNIFDRGQHDGTYYIAMEYLRGRSLKDVIDEDSPLSQEQAIDFAVQILQAAGFAHRRGIVHRDLKPGNVIVADDGSLKVTDFGIARAGASEMTETGSIMGTAQYLSPEQAQGHATTERSDLYSVGVVLWEMLTGRVPFEGGSAVSIALKHLSEEPAPLRQVRPDVHPELERVVAGALAKDPAHRPATAADFIAQLEVARSAIRAAAAGDRGEPTTAFAPVAAPTSVLPPVPPPVQRTRIVAEEPVAVVAEEHRPRPRWPYALILLALLGVGLIAYVLLRADPVAVPGVEGRSQDTATLALERAGFEVQVRPQESRTVPEGRVIDQDPEPREEAAEGSTVTIVTSSGPGEAEVPAVEGLSQRRAFAALREAGFRPGADRESSADVPEGRVIRTVPREGLRREVGSRVRVVVSTGPPLVTVPNVVGQSSDAAGSALEAEGLTAASQQQESADVPEGQVISQAPAGGAEAERGSRVTLTVSSGPPVTEVPDVVGISAARARRAIEDAGLVVEVRDKQTDAQSEDGDVLVQRPPPGTRREEGRTVVILVGVYDESAAGADPPAGDGEGIVRPPEAEPPAQ